MELKSFFSKIFVRNPIFDSEKNSNRFGIRTLESTIKVQKISIFLKRVIYEEVNSIISTFLLWENGAIGSQKN
jgi:hypothetical protein